MGSTQQVSNAADELCWTAATAGACGVPPAGATTYAYDTRGNRTGVTPPPTAPFDFGREELLGKLPAGGARSLNVPHRPWGSTGTPVSGSPCSSESRYDPGCALACDCGWLLVEPQRGDGMIRPSAGSSANGFRTLDGVLGALRAVLLACEVLRPSDFVPGEDGAVVDGQCMRAQTPSDEDEQSATQLQRGCSPLLPAANAHPGGRRGRRPGHLHPVRALARAGPSRPGSLAPLRRPVTARLRRGDRRDAADARPATFRLVIAQVEGFSPLRLIRLLCFISTLRFSSAARIGSNIVSAGSS